MDSRVRLIAWASLAVQVGIVATGGAVRLTGSGLGCPTWPQCTPGAYVVQPELGIHGAIEFGNRMLTFVLAAVAVAAVMLVWKWRRSRPDLFRMTLALAAGIPAQAALGGLTVLTGLDPWLVGAHFIVSALLVSVATVFVVRSYGEPPARPAPRAPFWSRAFARTTHVAAACAAATLVLGVVTTGAGPHAGDAATPRNGLDVETLQHVHSASAYALLALTLFLAGISRLPGYEPIRPFVFGLLAAELAQIVIGLVQVRLGVPALLVGVHMVVACAIVACMTALLAATHSPARA